MMFLAAAWALVAVLATRARGGITYPDCAAEPLKSNLVCNTSASPEDRATALVKAMANSDKLANLVKWVVASAPNRAARGQAYTCM